MSLLRAVLNSFRRPSGTVPIADIAGLEVRARLLADSMRAGAARSARHGSGIEPESIRRYVPGDDVRALDWRVTARRGELHVRRFEEERDLDVLLVVDRCRSLSSAGTDLPGIAARDTAAALSLAAVEAGHRTGLIVATGEASRVVPPGRSRRQWRTTLAALHEPARGGGMDLPGALKTARGLLRSRSMVVVLGDFVPLAVVGSSSEIDRELSGLAHRHDLVPLVFRAPQPRDLLGLGRVRIGESEGRRSAWMDVRQEALPPDLHARALEQLRELGVTPVSIDPRKPLAPQLRLRFGAATRRAA